MNKKKNQNTTEKSKTYENLNRKAFIKTYGCQMNVNDSEFITGQLSQLGYLTTEDIFNSDLILLNTCCVRAKVEQKIYSLIGKIKKIKENNTNIILGICGCIASKEKDTLFNKFPYIDLIFGPSQMNELKKIIIERKESNNKKYISYENNPEFSLRNTPINRESKISAWIQIMRGCNNYCSYCVVPYTRGPEQSRLVLEILSEVENLAHNNYKEIFLLGQNVNSYGKNLPEPVAFSKLLTFLNNINGIERIRFMTSHPKDLNFDLIKVIRNSDKVCEHIHLPIQAGSDKILKIMNREYNIDQYKSIIKEIRNNIDNVSITTDIMVGFPGETEEDFQQTLDTFEEIKFDDAFTFIYSNRENTLASLMPSQVPLQVKKERLWKLINLQRRISSEINKKLEGEILEVLVDKKSIKNISGQLSGRTKTNKTVVFNGEDKLVGQLIKVKILESDTWTLYGELVK